MKKCDERGHALFARHQFLHSRHAWHRVSDQCHGCARAIRLRAVVDYLLRTFHGVEKCADPARERNKVDAFVSTMNQIVFDLPAALVAARVRAALEARGEMIGPYDVLIAGQALSLGLTLVTDNTKEFARVPGLTIENWQSTAG